MSTTNLKQEIDVNSIETLDSYIIKDDDYRISNKARFTAFKYRTKVEFLRFFIV